MRNEVALLGILLLLLLFLFGMGGFGMHWMPMMGFGWIFWILVFVAIYYLFVEKKREGKNSFKILDERYARGEIGREEYLEMKKELRGG
ncbi:MAG: SHOCT domain-containing protein [Candidatus Methanofastidiosia archaeon]